MPNYTYGGFSLNAASGGLGYFLVAKDLDFPTYKATLSPLARYDGYKINGYQVSERQIQVDIIIIGTSRIDCIARKDTLEAALALRDQVLVLHEDGRYWVANATASKVKFAAGKGIVQCTMPVTFLCADPYAKAANPASPFDTGSLTYTLSGGSYVSPVQSFAGGGTIYSWPTIHLIHQTTSPGGTTLSSALTQGTSYTALPVASSPALSVGQVLTLYYATGAPLNQLWTQKVTVSQAVSAGATSIPVQSFVANYAFPVTSTTASISTAWNQVTIAQLTDNYILSATSTSGVPLPQKSGDYLDINCDPATGWTIVTNGLPQQSDPVGAFPPLEPSTTQWQITIASDWQPTVDASWAWTPRYLS